MIPLIGTQRSPGIQKIPSVVGKGHHNAYRKLADWFKTCVGNDTCYRLGWVEGDGVSEIKAAEQLTADGDRILKE